MNALIRVRAALVIPAIEHSTTNLDQITWSGSGDNSASIPDVCSTSRMASARRLIPPASSPKDSRGVGPMLAITPGEATLEAVQ